jgi:hypothetical protein
MSVTQRSLSFTQRTHLVDITRGQVQRAHRLEHREVLGVRGEHRLEVNQRLLRRSALQPQLAQAVVRQRVLLLHEERVLVKLLSLVVRFLQRGEAGE